MHLWSHEFNFSTHMFYKREGFEVIDRIGLEFPSSPELNFEWFKNQMMETNFRVIQFDAEITLWENEILFSRAQKKICELHIHIKDLEERISKLREKTQSIMVMDKRLHTFIIRDISTKL